MDLRVLRRKREVGDGDSSVMDQVLSWSIDEIFDETLFKDKVKRVPDTFQSNTEYFDAFVFPLLEETCAHLCSSMEMISRAPFAALVPCYKCRDSGTSLFDVKVDYWRCSMAGPPHGHELNKVSPGDVLVFVESKVQTVHALRLAGAKCVLASVVNVLEDDMDGSTSSTSFRMKTSHNKGLLNSGSSSRFLSSLINATKCERIWKVIHMRGNVVIIVKVLQSCSMASPSHSIDLFVCMI